MSKCVRCRSVAVVNHGDNNAVLCLDCALAVSGPQPVGRSEMAVHKREYQIRINSWFDGRQHGYREGMRWGTAIGVVFAIAVMVIVREFGGGF